MPAKKKSQGPSPAAGENPVLASDTEISFPEFVLLKASAGSGKTYALTLRFVQFLLSDRIRLQTGVDLPNILAVTFTKNAAQEMKRRILDWLKDCWAEPADKEDGRLARIQAVASAPRGRLKELAAEAVDRILDRYSDFQVQTIDSFTAAVFKASAVDLGISPDFTILLDPSELIAYAFSRYVRRINKDSQEGRDFDRIIELLIRDQKGESAFLWDPAPKIREQVDGLYKKLSLRNKPLAVEDFGRERGRLEEAIGKAAGELEGLVARSGLEKTTRGHCHTKVLPAVADKDFVALMDCSFKTDPVKPGGTDRKAYDRVMTVWHHLEDLVKTYGRLYARSYYYPYLLAYRSFAATLDQVKRQQGAVFIDDINTRLAGYIDQGIVPDVYFRLGDRIFHFLIDEFQDTSRMQWTNLVPLIENSLAAGGSLFLVGDTKQAIYGFRDADYRIMTGLESGTGGPFGSAEVRVRELTSNFRCRREILDFVKSRFLLDPPRSDGDGTKPARRKPLQRSSGEEAPPDKEKYRAELLESELSVFNQEAADRGADGHPGHVEYRLIERETPQGKDSPEHGDEEERNAAPAEDEDETAANRLKEDPPEKREVQDIVENLRSRGFALSDIAVLTYRNESVVKIASWLNDKRIPFIAFSCLDIRQRRVVAEILKLLQFLDSPPDNLSLAAFLLGDVWNKKLSRDAGLVSLPAPPEDLPAEWHRFLFDCRLKGESPLYTAFRRRYPGLWERYLERFFKIVGYYPLYDLVTLIFRMFDVFALFPKEEASLTRLLEVIKDFEGQGRNDLREFLALSGNEKGDPSPWTVDVPPDIEAVRIMSIHKAKGLGFPAVVLLLYGEGSWKPGFFFEEAEDAVRVLKITGKTAEMDAGLQALYADAQTRDRVGRLNALYVAMTRASAELHVIGVKGKRTSYPFDFLGTKPYVSTDASQMPIKPDARPRAPQKDSPPETLLAETLRSNQLFELPLNPRETMNRDNIRRGEIAHALLAGVEYLGDDLAGDLDRAAARLGTESEEAAVIAEVSRTLVSFLGSSGIRPHFKVKPGRRVFTELEVCDALGRLRRLDRVVLDPDRVIVIEFKTGIPSDPARRPAWEEEDRRIFRDYLNIMKDVYPGRPVSGLFAFIDRGTQESVG